MNHMLNTAVNQSKNVVTIIITREEARNALSPATMAELIRTLKKYDSDPDIKVIVLTGAGTKAFSAGGHFDDIANTNMDSLTRYDGANVVSDMFRVIYNLNKPIVARINGQAMGSGFGLAAACDITVAVEDAIFGIPEINVGILPCIALAPILRICSSPKILLEMTLTGKMMNAQSALELGIINYVVPRDALDAKVDEIVHKLLEKNPRIVSTGRRYFNDVIDMQYEQTLKYGAGISSMVSGSRESIEGIAAFFEKRKTKRK